MSSDEKSKRPANTAFKQQRLKAWQPILTPKTVLPTFFIIGVLFAPIGGVLFYVSENVSEMVIDYSSCDKAGNAFENLSDNLFSYSLPNTGDMAISAPQYKFGNASLPGDVLPGGDNSSVLTSAPRCTIKIQIPVNLKPPVFLYYRLTGFYQNHRKYVKSFDVDQLSGTRPHASRAVLAVGGCTDLVGPSGTDQVYYPCGLIANSMFNDTISLQLKATNDTISDQENTAQDFMFSNQGITWASDKKKYGPAPYDESELGSILPPPNWATRYKDGKYSDVSQLPDLPNNEHFQVWMRTAGLPNFRKLYGRSDTVGIKKGVYTLDVDTNFNTSYYGGTKAIVISTVSFLGGKNPFLGIAYITVAVVCVILGCVFTLRHLYRPRKLGDHTYLTWNQQGGPAAGGASPENPRSPMSGGGH